MNSYSYNRFGSYSAAFFFALGMFLLGITLFQFFSPKLSLEEKLRQDEETEVNALILPQSIENLMLATARVVPSAVHIQNYPLPVLCWRGVLSGFEKGIKKRLRKQTLGRGSNTKRKQVPEGWCRAYHPSTNKPYLWNMETRRQNGKIDTGIGYSIQESMAELSDTRKGLTCSFYAYVFRAYTEVVNT